jgi:microcystin-dependent protein
MSTPFLSEIKIMSFGFPPKGWAMCNGQQMNINQNQALFSLLGTTYGGDGRVTFGIPNLQGRVPTSFGNGLTLGQLAGEMSHTLSVLEMPQHNHLVNASTATSGGSADPGGRYLGGGNNVYYGGQSPNVTTLSPSEISQTGGTQPHQNMQPYLTLNFCIALQGIFPSQN